MIEQPKLNMELSRIGLTAEDIENRGVAAVGYGTNELFPPYDNILHRIRAQKILEHVKTSTNFAAFKSPFVFSNTNWQRCFPDKKVIEVVGGLASFCVKDAVESITENGLYALVDSGMTFASRWHPDFILNKHLKESVSTEVKHLKLGRGKYIFYKTGNEHK